MNDMFLYLKPNEKQQFLKKKILKRFLKSKTIGAQ